MKENNIIEILAQVDISDEDKLLFLWLIAETKESNVCIATNQDLSNIFCKHPTNISKSINRLKKAGLLLSDNIDGNREITLSGNAKTLINNYYLSKEKKINKIIINNKHLITPEDCYNITEDLLVDFFSYSSIEIEEHLLKQIDKPFLKKVKSAKQLTSFFRLFLNNALKEGRLTIDHELDYDNKLLTFGNVLRLFCGFEREYLEIDDSDQQRQAENDRILKKHHKKTYEESITDYTNQPQDIQKSCDVFKVGSVVGLCTNLYSAGSPKFFNFTLDVNGCAVYAAVMIAHQPDLEGFSRADVVGKTLQITGKISKSSFHLKKHNIANIINSSEVLTPVRILSPISKLAQVDPDIFNDCPF